MIIKLGERELSISGSVFKGSSKIQRSTGQIARGIELDVESCMNYRMREFLTFNLHLLFLAP